MASTGSSTTEDRKLPASEVEWVDSRPMGAVLRAMEADLRRDEEILEEIRRDLRTTPVPRPTWPTRWIVGATFVAVAAASFVVGRETAPAPASVAASVGPTGQTQMPPSSLDAKRIGLGATYGSEFGPVSSP